MVVSPKAATVKFLCSYGGKILPRYPDGMLRYYGGHTRVLAVNRSVSFSELTAKMAEMCGSPVILRCQLPNEDLDALVSVTSDEDLANLIEEYDRVSAASSKPFKVRAFLSPPKSSARKSTISPPPGTASPSEPSSSSSYSSSSSSSTSPRYSAKPPLPRSPPRLATMSPYYGWYVNRKPSHIYLIHNGNHWQ